MKIKLLFVTAITAILLATTACQSASEMRAERVNSCSNICKNHPEIKTMSTEEGGGFLFFLMGGYQKETCICNRGGA